MIGFHLVYQGCRCMRAMKFLKRRLRPPSYYTGEKYVCQIDGLLDTEEIQDLIANILVSGHQRLISNLVGLEGKDATGQVHFLDKGTSGSPEPYLFSCCGCTDCSLMKVQLIATLDHRGSELQTNVDGCIGKIRFFSRFPRGSGMSVGILRVEIAAEKVGQPRHEGRPIWRKKVLACFDGQDKISMSILREKIVLLHVLSIIRQYPWRAECGCFDEAALIVNPSHSLRRNLLVKIAQVIIAVRPGRHRLEGIDMKDICCPAE